MKDKRNIIICIIASMLSAAIGFIIGISVNIDLSDNNEYVGTYKTSGWNGDEEVVLVLDKDNTCIHPSKGSNCKWKVSESNIITLTVPTQEYKSTYIEMYLNEQLSDENINLLIEFIKNSGYITNGKKGKFYGVGHIEYNKEQNMLRLYVDEEYIDTIASNLETLPQTKNLPMTFSIKKIEKSIGGTFDTTEDISVRVVDGGVMMHGFFFEKIKKSD